MALLTASFEFRGDKVFAVFENRVIAAGDDFDDVSKDAEEYLGDVEKGREDKDEEKAKKAASHVETPNGLKGTILSRVPGLWGDEITVRLENNQIRRFETTAGLKFSKEATTEPANHREALQTVLDRTVTPTREGLIARLRELDAVRIEASTHVASAGFSEQQGLNQLVITAGCEMQEVKDALAHLSAIDAENAAPAAPVYAAVEQASLGHSDDWLEHVAREMVVESEAQDFEKLLTEGPVVLVSSLDDGAVHNAGTVREIAYNHVVTKTAGFQGDGVQSYRENFVANAEAARRRELTYRKDVQHKEATRKEASTEDVPDEGLFL